MGMQLKEWAWGVSELQSTYNGHAKVGQRERGKKLTLLASLSAGAKGIGLCGPACWKDSRGARVLGGTMPTDSGGQSKDPQRRREH